MPPRVQPTEVRVSRFCGASQDARWTSEEPDPLRILVVAPGAGTRLNAPVYANLRRLGYSVEVVDYPADWNVTRNGYPPNWTDNGLLRPKGANLAGLAAVVGERARAGKPPAAIVCGSRGGQVTIGLVWRHYWRGPTVVINAGFLMTSAPLYEGVFPVMVSLTDDEFETRSADVCVSKFRALAGVHRGVLVQLEDDHMPRELLKLEIGNVLGVAIARADVAACGERLWGLSPLTRVWCLDTRAPAIVAWG